MAKTLIVLGVFGIVFVLLYILFMLVRSRISTPLSPAILALKAVGIKATETDQRICQPGVWSGNSTLLTHREQQFYQVLRNSIDKERWLLCPQVRVADVVKVATHIQSGSKTWWQLFRTISQWHCDVVIVDASTFAIVAVIELDDASHLKKIRIRRDILLEEIFRQAGIPLLRGRNAEKLAENVKNFLLEQAAEQEVTPPKISPLIECQTF